MELFASRRCRRHGRHSRPALRRPGGDGPIPAGAAGLVSGADLRLLPSPRDRAAATTSWSSVEATTGWWPPPTSPRPAGRCWSWNGSPRSAARRSASRSSRAWTCGCRPTPTWSASCPTGSSRTWASRSGSATAPSPPTPPPRAAAARRGCWSSGTRAPRPRRPSGSSPAPTPSSPGGSASTPGWPPWPRTSPPPSPSGCCPPRSWPPASATRSCGTTCASGRWPTWSPTTSPTTSSAGWP